MKCRPLPPSAFPWNPEYRDFWELPYDAADQDEADPVVDPGPHGPGTGPQSYSERSADRGLDRFIARDDAARS